MIRIVELPSARPLAGADEFLRALAARVLYAASSALAALAAHVERRVARREFRGAVEFHALYGEAGAPEGAIYVDGRLLGRIEGVRRL